MGGLVGVKAFAGVLTGTFAEEPWGEFAIGGLELSAGFGGGEPANELTGEAEEDATGALGGDGTCGALEGGSATGLEDSLGTDVGDWGN